MNILYITLSRPDLKTHGIYPDLSRALRDRGHKLTIVYSASPREQERTELVTEEGVEILKVVVGENFNVSLIKKGINALRMEPLLKQGIKKYLSDRHFDLCIYATPPVTFAGVVDFAKKKYGLKTFLMLKDIFPRNAVDIGLFKESSPVFLFFKAKERKLYKLSDRIGCMSAGNVRYIEEHEPWIERSKLLVFPNTIEKPKVFARKKRDEKLRLVFGGNLGKPQAIDRLLSFISDKRLTENKNIVFYIIGEGSEKEAVKRAAETLQNLKFRDFMPTGEYDRLMGMMDVGIISLDPRFTIPNYPSRILGYMKAGMAVLACTDRVTDIRELVEEEAKCGLWCYSDDREGFVQAVLRLYEDRELPERLGRAGYEYLVNNFTVERSVRLLEEAAGILN